VILVRLLRRGELGNKLREKVFAVANMAPRRRKTPQLRHPGLPSTVLNSCLCHIGARHVSVQATESVIHVLASPEFVIAIESRHVGLRLLGSHAFVIKAHR